MGNSAAEADGQPGDQTASPFPLGSLVFGRLPGLPTWPGQVMPEGFVPSERCRKLKQPPDSHVLVRFFGDGSYMWYGHTGLFHFKDRYTQYSKGSDVKKNKLYKLALEEAKEVADRHQGIEPTTNHHPLDYKDGATWIKYSVGPVQVPPEPSAEDLQGCTSEDALSWIRDAATLPLADLPEVLEEDVAKSAAGLCWLTSWNQRTLLSYTFEKEMSERVASAPHQATMKPLGAKAVSKPSPTQTPDDPSPTLKAGSKQTAVAKGKSKAAERLAATAQMVLDRRTCLSPAPRKQKRERSPTDSDDVAIAEAKHFKRDPESQKRARASTVSSSGDEHDDKAGESGGSEEEEEEEEEEHRGKKGKGNKQTAVQPAVKRKPGRPPKVAVQALTTPAGEGKKAKQGVSQKTTTPNKNRSKGGKGSVAADQAVLDLCYGLAGKWPLVEDGYMDRPEEEQEQHVEDEEDMQPNIMSKLTESWPPESLTCYCGPCGAQAAAEQLTDVEEKDKLLYGGQLEVTLPDLLSWVRQLAVDPIPGDTRDVDSVLPLLKSHASVGVLRLKEAVQAHSCLHRHGEVGLLARTAMEDLGYDFITSKADWPVQPPENAPPELLTSHIWAFPVAAVDQGKGEDGDEELDQDVVISEEEEEESEESEMEADEDEVDKGKGKKAAALVATGRGSGRGKRGGQGGRGGVSGPRLSIGGRGRQAGKVKGGGSIRREDEEGVEEEEEEEEEEDVSPFPLPRVVQQVTVEFKEYAAKVPTTEAAFQAAFQRWQAERNQDCSDQPQIGPHSWRPYELFRLVADEGGSEVVTTAGRWHAVATEWQKQVLELKHGDGLAPKQVSPHALVKVLEHQYQRLLSKFEKFVSAKCTTRQQVMDKHDERGKPVFQDLPTNKTSTQPYNQVKSRDVKKKKTSPPGGSRAIGTGGGGGGGGGGRYDLDDFGDLDDEPSIPHRLSSGQLKTNDTQIQPPAATQTKAASAAVPANAALLQKQGSLTSLDVQRGPARKGAGTTGANTGRDKRGAVGGATVGVAAGRATALKGSSAMSTKLVVNSNSHSVDPELRRVWIRYPDSVRVPNMTRAWYILSPLVPMIKKEHIAVNAPKYPGITLDCKDPAEATLVLQKLQPKLIHLFPELRLDRTTAPTASIRRVPPLSQPLFSGPHPSTFLTSSLTLTDPSSRWSIPPLQTQQTNQGAPPAASPRAQDGIPLSSQQSQQPHDPRRAAQVRSSDPGNRLTVAPDVFSVTPVAQPQPPLPPQLLPYDPRRNHHSMSQQAQQPRSHQAYVSNTWQHTSLPPPPPLHHGFTQQQQPPGQQYGSMYTARMPAASAGPSMVYPTFPPPAGPVPSTQETQTLGALAEVLKSLAQKAQAGQLPGQATPQPPAQPPAQQGTSSTAGGVEQLLAKLLQKS